VKFFGFFSHRDFVWVSVSSPARALELPVFLATHPIHGLVQFRGAMKLVVPEDGPGGAAAPGGAR
jgi:hypothetical protein